MGAQTFEFAPEFPQNGRHQPVARKLRSMAKVAWLLRSATPQVSGGGEGGSNLQQLAVLSHFKHILY